MREPSGTTRKGQVLLGGLGLIVGVGSGLALMTRPGTFEPILELALYALGWLLRAHLHYDPSQRIFFATLLPALGAIWAFLMGRAFAREPARNRAIDTYLRRKGEIDQAPRVIIVSKDDRLV